jgi:hypothetical protein
MAGTPVSFMFFVLIIVAMAQGVWRWRRTTAVGLMLVLGTFTFGMAVHSVHHLSEPEKAAECLVFSASQHASGILAEPYDVHVPQLVVPTASPDNPDVPTAILRFRADLPRAPPSSLT